MNRTNANLFRAGFTLIEIMVAMVVLAILVVMVGNIFQQVSDSWNIGTQSSEANTAGRAAMTFMAQELAQAVAGPIEAAPGVSPAPNPDLVFMVDGVNELRFVTLTGEPNAGDNRRALRGAIFRLETDGAFEHTLRYRRETASNPYLVKPADWNYQSIEPVISNVVDFQAYVYADYNGIANAITAPLPFTSNQLPACVDLYLEILSEGDMRRWESLSGVTADDFLDRNAMCYSTRVFFLNRKGYAAR